MTANPKENLVHWLRDAYAMEGQAIELLERQIERLENYPEAIPRLRQHLDETRRQQQMLEECFARLGTDPSAFKESMMRFAANVQGLLHGLAEDEVLKHAIGSHAFEQFEAGCYRVLVTAAQRAGEPEIARTCEEIMRQEEAMARWVWEQLPRLTEQFLDRAATGGPAKR